MSINTTHAKNLKSYEKVVSVYNALKNHENIAIIETLLKKEGDINYKIIDNEKSIPNLLKAAWYVSSDVFCLLLDHGVDFTFKDNQGRTFVHDKILEEIQSKYEISTLDIFKNEFIHAVLSAHVRFNNPSNPCDTNGFSHFHIACITNNTAAVEFFLENGIDVDQVVNADSSYFPSYTPLHFAVKYTYPCVVEILLKFGANIHLKNSDGLSPLHSIIDRKIKKYEITTELDFVRTFDILVSFAIENGTITDELGFCKCHIACLFCDGSTLDNLLKEVENINQAVNLDSPVCAGFTALHFAAYSNADVFKLLLVNGADIEAKNAHGETPFDLCLQNFNANDIYSIISSKTEWKSIILSDNKTTLLQVVMATGELDKYVSFLESHVSALKAHVPFDSPLWPGYTLLHIAVALSKKESDPNLSYFALNNDTKIVAECLKFGADMTIADATGSTALHLGFYMQKRHILKYLLDYHDKIDNPVDNNGLSHFHIACSAGHPKLVQHFISNGVNINNQVFTGFRCNAFIDERYCSRYFFIFPGSTALHFSVVNGDIELTELLLRNGADVHIQDVNGFTALHRLILCGVLLDRNGIQLAKLLFGVENLRNCKANCGLSHLHVACYFRHCDAVEKLLETGVNVNEIVNYESFSRLTDYDEIHTDNNFAIHEPISILTDFNGYRPIDFLWHPRSNCYYSFCKDFWRMSFMLINQNTGVLAENDKTKGLLENLFLKIQDYNDYFSYSMLTENVALQESLELIFGITTLHVGCYLNDVELVESLITRGVNVNAKVDVKSPIWKGLTALHLALKIPFRQHFDKDIIDKMTKIIELLINHGADPYLVDINNDTPLHMIKKLQSRDDVNLMKIFFPIIFENMNGSNINPTNNEGLSLFHVACVTQNELAIQKFLKNGVDVNQSISDFSDFCPGQTALHLLIKYYIRPARNSFVLSSNYMTFSKLLDMLIKNEADVNKTDVFGESPLFKVLDPKNLRRTMIQKLISKGADVFATNSCGNTVFELLLREGDKSWEEIEIFRNAGFHFNTYNTFSDEGYMAQAFRFHLRKTSVKDYITEDDTILHNVLIETKIAQKLLMPSPDNIMKNQIFLNILNDSEITGIDKNTGRTSIHNVVSIKYEHIVNDGIYVPSKYVSRRRFGFDVNRFYDRAATTTYKGYYGELIRQLCIRGCDIDHQDNEGKTALHLAVAFRNNRALVPLLKNGADINIIDKYGKTAFSYCCDIKSAKPASWKNDEYSDRYYDHKVLATHVYKLEFCGQYIHDQNKKMQVEVLKVVGNIGGKELQCFHKELEKTKSKKIGNTSFSLYEFLTNPHPDVVYMDMKKQERREVDKYFKNSGHCKFVEIDSLLKLKYRQTFERTKLIELALTALNELIMDQLPDLCARIIFNFLTNEDLKRLIAANN